MPPLARLAAHSIHRYGKLPVRPLAATFTNNLHGARVPICRISAGSHASDTNLSVSTAIPMWCDGSLVGFIVKIDHDFLDQNAGESLPGSRLGARRVPRRRQIVRQWLKRRFERRPDAESGERD